MRYIKQLTLSKKYLGGRHGCYQQKRIRKTCGIFLLYLFLCATAGLVLAQEAGEKTPEYLVYLSGQTTFYAGDEYTLRWDKGKDCWEKVESFIVTVSYANHTILKRHLKRKFPLEFRFKYPNLRPGVVAKATLAITPFYKGDVQEGVYKQSLFFFSKDNYVGYEKALEEFEIGIVDYTEDSRLNKFLKDIHIPFEKIRNFNNFSGKWIICSGLDFEKNYSLFDELSSATERGVSVLVLPPVKGIFSLPH